VPVSRPGLVPLFLAPYARALVPRWKAWIAASVAASMASLTTPVVAVTRVVAVVTIALLWPDHAKAGPYFDSLRSGLLSCQAALRGALRQAEIDSSHERVALCEPHLEALLGNSYRPGTSLSTTQKQALLVLTERQLRLVRDLVDKARALPPESHAKGPYLSRLTAFENGFRVFHERLFALETWILNSGARLGVARYANEDMEPIGGASAFLLLDHGSKVDAAFEIATSTPLREDGGLVHLPPREVDAVAITQAWVDFKRYRSFQLKLGVFPDTEGFIAPRRWPFVSLQGRASLYRGGLFELGTAVRHDTFGVFSPQQAETTARLFERNLSEVMAGMETLRSDVEWLVRAGWRLHWFTDSSNRLASLSVGRRRYLEDAPAPDGTRYRVSDRSLLVRATFPDERVSIAAKAQAWKNILTPSGGRGHFVGAETHARLGQFELSLEAARAEVACASLPPLALRHVLFPGTRSTFAEVGIAYAASPALQLSVRGLRNRAKGFGSGSVCAGAPSTQSLSNTPTSEILFGFVYKFPDDAAQFN
jgi:hypothetical protein